ncbi:MAG: phosphoadenosine phosphosulfate reductase family protein [Selenomonadaceae bacterium]|nr:phosphoadenosine phosphosulfate reductase family protein [Selenomonadaceae bacterium]
MKHIVSFSGGKDSTAMLLMMLEKNIAVDDIIFCDTGVEFPALYQHVEEVERYIDRKITRLKWDGGSYEWEFAHHVKLRGNNLPGKGWASFRNRWCTQYFKSRPSKKYLKGTYGKNYTLYIGIAYDEPKRHKNIPANVVHPLYDWQITEVQALEYCKSKGFDFGGLYDIFPRLGCYCCPLQRKQSWRALYDNFPELFEKSLQMEAECEHDTKFATGKKLADYSAEFKAADEMERISIPLFVYECPKEREE